MARRTSYLRSNYNHFLPDATQSDRSKSVDVVLVSPRNPLNIGAVARAMANFGFEHLSVVAPYEPHWREARSAVGADALLEDARIAESLAEAVASCTLVVGTGTLTHRRPEQRVVQLPDLPLIVQTELDRGGRVAIVFGPEKHGLTRDDLSWCHLLVEIPTDPRQPSMNLGQAAAVCLYELASRVKDTGASPSILSGQSSWDLEAAERPEIKGESDRTRAAAAKADAPSGGFAARLKSCPDTKPSPILHEASLSGSISALQGGPTLIPSPSEPGSAAPSASLDRLATVIEETMLAARYSPRSMQEANRHDLRLLLRRLAPTPRDARRILGLFRRMLWRLKQIPKTK